MSASLSRTSLFGSAWDSKADPIRPPWSLPETAFTESCTVCGDCIAACPPSILLKGRAGYPVVDFSSGACDFCGACADACSESAFGPRDEPPWRLTAYFGDDCLSSRGITCRVCAEWCDAHAIRIRLAVGGRAHPQIDEAACTGCGACISVCPVKTIHLEEAI